MPLSMVIAGSADESAIIIADEATVSDEAKEVAQRYSDRKQQRPT